MWVKSFLEKDLIQWEPPTSHFNSLFVSLWGKKVIFSHGMFVNLLFSSLLSKTIWAIQVVYPDYTLFPGETEINFPDLLG